MHNLLNRMAGNFRAVLILWIDLAVMKFSYPWKKCHWEKAIDTLTIWTVIVAILQDREEKSGVMNNNIIIATTCNSIKEYRVKLIL